MREPEQLQSVFQEAPCTLADRETAVYLPQLLRPPEPSHDLTEQWLVDEDAGGVKCLVSHSPGHPLPQPGGALDHGWRKTPGASASLSSSRFLFPGACPALVGAYEAGIGMVPEEYMAAAHFNAQSILLFGGKRHSLAH